MNHQSEALHREVVRQLQSPHLQRQIQRQLADAIAGKKTTGTIRIKVPVPTDNTKTDYVPNVNRGKKRFVLNGTQQKEPRG